MKRCILIVLVLFSTTGFTQSKKTRIQPGRIYQPGEMLYAPRYGFTARVPEGWEGSLPRESEVLKGIQFMPSAWWQAATLAFSGRGI